LQPDINNSNRNNVLVRKKLFQRL